MSSNLVQRLRTWSSKQIFIVSAAFLVYVLADGTTFSFGLYVDELINEYSKFKSKTVLRVSILAALMQSVPLLFSPFVCWWTTKFGASTASFIGCILASTGFSLPYLFQFTNTFWIPAFAYGCLLSIGLAFCYVPAYLILPFYFEDDRGLATGLAVSGSGVGQVVLAILIKACILKYDWRGASFITGGLFLYMFISVLAFRQPAASSNPVASSKTEALNDSINPLSINPNKECLQQTREAIGRSHSRSATIAHVLPLLISSVPIHSSVIIPSVAPSIIHYRHSFSHRTRNYTITTDPSANRSSTTMPIQRVRANTIAIPLQTMRKVNRSFEEIHQLPSLASVENSSEYEEEEEEEEQQEQEEQSSLKKNQFKTFEESSREKYWLWNSRFLLFCFSNFALCLVMGVPYVILPTYISETFLNQNFLASWALSNVGFASAAGQILLGYLHDRKILSAWFMYTLAVIISGASLIILALFRYKAIVLSCAFIYGLAISANYALQMLIVIDALSMDNMASAFGILQFCQGVSTLIGIPIQGLLRDLSQTYKLSFLTSGFIIILSGVSMFLWPCFTSTNKQIRKNIDNNQ